MAAQPPPPPPPRPLDSFELTRGRLPDLRRGDVRTKSKSRSEHVFLGHMEKWETFEKEVRKTFNETFSNHINNQQWRGRPVIWTGQTVTNGEVVVVANEIGVVGRFLHNVGHVMTLVGHDLALGVYFGDWKEDPQTGIPDITLWNNYGQNLLAGGAKTPWTIYLAEIMQCNGQTFVDKFIRIAAYYMKEYHYKYAFFTTYDETVFFKQESRVFDGEEAKINGLAPGSKREVLCYSNPFHHTTNSRPTGPVDGRPPGIFVDTVSTRECFLHMMRLVKMAGSQGYYNNDNVWETNTWDGFAKPTLLKKPAPKPPGK
ncbi:MAG: hypothetical protein Q9168_004760 [Polycauliona sp. 1 TL-2023]